MTEAIAADAIDRPLVVDLNGTLLKSDLVVESLFALWSTKPLRGLTVLSALRRRRAGLKASIINEAALDLDTLPFNQDLIAFLRAEKEKGRRIFLATGANEATAEAIATHLGLFDGVLSVSNGTLRKGAAKAAMLLQAFGAGNFDYVGDDTADMQSWQAAGGVFVVGASAGTIRIVRERFPDATIIAPRTTTFLDYLRALRVHQWIKNLLILVPAFTAHHFDAHTALAALLGFLSFSFCASSVYLLNDLLDLRNDRNHPTKQLRPFASAQVNMRHGLVIFPAALILSVAIGLLLPWTFLLTLAGYYVLTLAYSTYLKSQIILDVVALACLYGMRLVGGATSVDVPLSPWILTFAVFIFLSLALVKRWTELVQRSAAGKGNPAGRGYRLTDLPVIQAMATASGYAAVLTICLYIASPTVSALYTKPNALWVIPLILLYWINRILLLTHRGEMKDDPVLFAAKDKVSAVCAALMLAAVLAGL
jgi:4-hydroxybenzoate polyprenyltransferase/phosphoserine phosphatase